MRYAEIVRTYEAIEQTSSRQRITDLLSDLLRRTPPALIGRLVFLTQGRLAPEFAGLEMGLAERLAARAVAQTGGVTEEEVRQLLASMGDLGLVAEHVLARCHHHPAPSLEVEEVWERLNAIARSSGQGAVGRKVRLLRELLQEATPREARYLLRTVTGKLRLGVADMTLLDALARISEPERQVRAVLERAYNLTSDLGFVAEVLVAGGLRRLETLGPQPGRPIRPMLAQRLHDAAEIMERMGGTCAAEDKYDGERVQLHRRDDGELVLFSRRLENITHQYPDVLRSVQPSLRARSAIVEGEVVAVEPGTDELRPFQELMHRRRKHRIEEAMTQYPVVLIAFDLLYADGEDFTGRPYPQRRQALERVLDPSAEVWLARQRVVHSAAELEACFLQAIADGSEGLVCKSVAPTSTYRAGAREWLWIKYKREYVSEMADSVDLVVVGALYGRGRRAGTYGSLLLAAYDPEADVFRATTKCGSGFSDRDLYEELPRRLKPLVLPHRHPRVDARLTPDVWFVPEQVIEVIGAEVTLSPVSSAALGQLQAGSGLAIRFPRFTGRYRDDKRPEDATTVGELIEMYRQQRRRGTA